MWTWCYIYYRHRYVETLMDFDSQIFRSRKSWTCCRLQRWVSRVFDAFLHLKTSKNLLVLNVGHGWEGNGMMTLLVMKWIIPENSLRLAFSTSKKMINLLWDQLISVSPIWYGPFQWSMARKVPLDTAIMAFHGSFSLRLRWVFATGVPRANGNATSGEKENTTWALRTEWVASTKRRRWEIRTDLIILDNFGYSEAWYSFDLET